MKKKFVAGVFAAILSLLSACSAPSIAPGLTISTVELTETVPVVATATAKIAVPTLVPAYGDGYSDNSPNPVSPSTPVKELTNQAYFQDHLATADMLVAVLDLAPAPSGQVYQGWVLKDGSFINAGVLEVQDDGLVHLEWSAPDSSNLVGSVTGLQVTLEPQGGSQSPGQVVYAGIMTEKHITLTRSLFLTNTGEPVTPRNKAFALAMIQQANLAAEHIKNAINAEAIGAEKEKTLHLEHVINILEGSKGERFKDYNEDGAAENPGDGFGVVAYAAQVREKLNQQDITDKTQEILDNLVKIELEIITILEKQPGAVSLADLRSHFDETIMKQLAELYSMAEQAVSFSIKPVTNP